MPARSRPCTSSAYSSSRPSLRQAFLFTIPLLMLVGACASDPQDVTVDGTETPTVEDSTETATSAPGDGTTEPVATLPPATAAADVPPSCDDVPAFQAAETVSIACAGPFAVSPELFASNAGWHLFEAQGNTWVEIDYARTCCEADDVPFTQLLGRNGLNQAMLTELCTVSGLASDSSSGCAGGGQEAEDIAFDGTWLRVNGLGEHDFGAGQEVVLAAVEQVFGPADSVDEASECGAGPMDIASFDDFTVQFQDGDFIGWYYVSSTPALATPSGVTVGISEADLEVVYEGVEIRDDTLGREFVFEVPAGFMAGFISDTDATVSSLYAGTSCFFR